MSVGERPTWSSKKYKNYNEFNKAVLAWKAKQPNPKKPKIGDRKTIPRRREKGGWTKSYQVIWNGKKWVKKGDPSLTPNRAVPGDNKADSRGYKESVKTNKSLKINSKKEDKPKNNNNVSKENNKENNQNNKEKVKTPKYKQVTQEELDKKLAEGKKNEKLKVKPKKMHAIEKRNRKRFGDAHVDKLKAQYKAFKAKRKKKKEKKK